MLGLSASSFAQFSVSSRLSTIQHFYFIGYAGDQVTDNQTVTNSNLLLSDVFGDAGSAHAAGYYAPNDHHWSGDATWNGQTAYQVAGTLSSASALHLSGSADVTVASNGCTIASQISQPGSQLNLEFSLGSTQNVRFISDIVSEGSAGSTTYLSEWNGNNWQTSRIFYQAHEDYLWTLGPGLYQLSSTAVAADGGLSHSRTSYDFTLQAVPEPASFAAMGLGLVGLLKRKRR